MRPRRARREHQLNLPLRIWVTGIGILLAGPAAVVIPMSFSSSSTFSFPPQGWSTRWYRNFFGSPEWLAALGNSVQIGLLVALLSSVVGTAAAIALDRSRFRGRAAVRSLAMTPMIVPQILVAIAIYSAFLQWQLVGGLLGFVLAHCVLAIPFVVIAVSTSLESFDRTVEKASASLGAGPAKTFLKITFPILLPGIASGFVLAFVSSFDEAVVSLFLQSATYRTLPVQMYESISLQTDPTISAAASLIVVGTTVIVALTQLRPRRLKEPRND